MVCQTVETLSAQDTKIDITPSDAQIFEMCPFFFSAQWYIPWLWQE